jgi:hypothetical protein
MSRMAVWFSVLFGGTDRTVYNGYNETSTKGNLNDQSNRSRPGKR